MLPPPPPPQLLRKKHSFGNFENNYGTTERWCFKTQLHCVEAWIHVVTEEHTENHKLQLPQTEIFKCQFVLGRHISVISKGRTDGQMFVLCNFPAEFLKQKAVPGSFIMKGKEAWGEGRGHTHMHTQRDFRFNSNQEIFQKFNYVTSQYNSKGYWILEYWILKFNIPMQQIIAQCTF